jgi:diguanylate cyclase (GGDEF)-like protein/PAS domain S-box-containing protein
LSSSPNRWLQLQRYLPDSIVARTTIAILALSMVLGLLFAWVVSGSAEHRERDRGQVRLADLVSTVEPTVRISCFLGDQKLAAEIGNGLMHSRIVGAVRITADGKDLFVAGHPPAGLDASTYVDRKISSPFNSAQPVGRIEVYPNRAQIEIDAHAYSRELDTILALQAALVALGVAIAVYFFITRPIRSVSTNLHRVRLDAGQFLEVPPLNQSDEIGSLVSDINALIHSLTRLFATERQLRIEREVGERKMQLIFEKAATGICLLDITGTLQSWNPAFSRILDVTGELILLPGITRLEDVFDPGSERIRELIRQSVNSGNSQELDLEILRSGASREAWVEISINPVGPDLLQGIVNDISDRKREELSAQRQATHDSLTGLLNRRGMQASLAALFERPRREAYPALALMQIDLDHFKQVNDTYGHEAGDLVLSHVARVLEKTLRRGDLLGRPGGDEFVAVLVGISDAAKVQEIAANMIAGISRPIDIGGGRQAQIGASIGISFADSEDSPQSLVRRADSSLYMAKQRGRGQACLADDDRDATQRGLDRLTSSNF